MDESSSSNFLEDFTIIDESGDSEDSDPYLDDKNDVIQVQPEHDTEIIEIESDSDEVMSIDESENSETESETNGGVVHESMVPEPVKPPPKAPNVHPYASLIKSFKYQKEQLKAFNVEMKTIDETTFEVVQDEEALMNMIGELRSQREISVKPQSYEQVHLVVITIGTMEKEYVLDVVKLSTLVIALTEIFVNPKIVKIVYNLEIVSSVLPNLYFVNVFDVKAAYFLKNGEQGAFHSLLSREYGCPRSRVSLLTIMMGSLTSEQIFYLRKGAHYLLLLYHDIKNYLLLNDAEKYMDFLETMRKESMSLKCYEQSVGLRYIKRDLVRYHECELDVLQKVDDWRNDKLAKGCLESGLPRKDLVAIARGLPPSVASFGRLVSVTLSLDHTSEILNIVRESRRRHHLPLKVLSNDKKQKKVANVALALTHSVSQIQQNRQNTRKNFKPKNMNGGRFSVNRQTRRGKPKVVWN